MDSCSSDRAVLREPEAAVRDRELLELAAKAAGYKIAWEGGCVTGWMAGGGWWNPLTDDGDALRLAAKLRLTLRIEDYGAAARQELAQRETPSAWSACEAHLHGGIESATRLAIVRAAAQIGSELRKAASGSIHTARSDDQSKVDDQEPTQGSST